MKRTWWVVVTAGALAAGGWIVVACDDGGDGDADSDTDADVDSDADADADSDADADADSDADGDTDGDTDADADGDSDGDADADSDGDGDADGECLSECTAGTDPLAGATCDGDTIMACATVTEGCDRYVGYADCSGVGQTCEVSGGSAGCVGACTDECTISDYSEIRCVDGVREVCSRRVGDCNVFTFGEDCDAAGLVCDPSLMRCCSHACSPDGATRCAATGEAIETCAPPEHRVCRDWVRTETCDAGYTCDDADGSAECVGNACTDVGGVCSTAGSLICAPGAEPYGADPHVGCGAGFCCVPRTSTECTGWGSGCYPTTSGGCSAYALVDDPVGSCATGFLCCTIPG